MTLASPHREEAASLLRIVPRLVWESVASQSSWSFLQVSWVAT
jgi:hypothetical protein